MPLNRCRRGEWIRCHVYCQLSEVVRTRVRIALESGNQIHIEEERSVRCIPHCWILRCRYTKQQRRHRCVCEMRDTPSILTDRGGNSLGDRSRPACSTVGRQLNVDV